MKTQSRFFIYLILFFVLPLNAISLVYNLKIRRAFNLSAVYGESSGHKCIFTAVPIAYSRNRTIIDTARNIDLQEKRLTVGSLFNFRFIPNNNWWAEISSGLENEFAKSEGSVNFNISHFGMDDLVFAGGYNFFIKKNTQFVLYGITGFPIRNKINLEDAQDALVGTRFYSLGIGSEFSYSFLQSIPRSLSAFFQNRFIHFFSRKWDPILPIGGKIEPGNLSDILFAARYREKTNIFEAGYNATFFTDQALILPLQKIEGKNFVRNGWYASYARGFKKVPALKKPGLIGFGFLISRSKRFDTKIASGWLNITIIF